MIVQCLQELEASRQAQAAAAAAAKEELERQKAKDAEAAKDLFVAIISVAA